VLCGNNQCNLLANNVDDTSGEFRVTCVNVGNVTALRNLDRQIDTKPSGHRSLATKCTKDWSGIGTAIKECKDTVCRIRICSKKIKATKRPKDQNTLGIGTIDLTGKNIEFECVLSCPTERCELNGGASIQLFSGSNSKITFTKFNFTNSKGGAIAMWGSSLTFLDCSFENNIATSGSDNTTTSGSAVSVNNTGLLIDGPTTSIINNIGNGAPFAIFSSSKVTINNAYFEGNNFSEYGRGIFALNSTINLGKNITFVNPANISRQRNLGTNGSRDCDLFVAAFDNDLQKESSCIKSDTGVSRLAQETCAPSPVPVLVPTCFSGWNMVEVKGGGNLRMDQLKIGDFVLSGNGRFSQIYGFGHLDHDQEAVYLQIDFAGSTENRTYDHPHSSTLEISPRHLILAEKDHVQYAIRAADVVMGESLNGLRVTNIQTVRRRGIYAPLTYSGDIIVSGVRSSNYVDNLDHDLRWNMHMVGHVLFFPQRVFCSAFIETCKKEGYIDGIGYFSYVLACGTTFINQSGTYITDVVISIIMVIFFVGYWNDVTLHLASFLDWKIAT
jgi:Hint module